MSEHNALGYWSGLALCFDKGQKQSSTLSCDSSFFVCLFELMLYVPVNRNGHVETLPPFLAHLSSKAHKVSL